MCVHGTDSMRIFPSTLLPLLHTLDEAEGEGEGQEQEEEVQAPQEEEAPKKKLTNQFNFCERAALTIANPSRVSRRGGG